MFKFLGGLIDSNEKQLKKLESSVRAINALEAEMEKLDLAGLKERALQLKNQLAQDLQQEPGEDGEEEGDRKPDGLQDMLDDFLVEAFALVREAAKRTLGQRHYDVQLMGGMVLHQGKIAEMKTGEGKTLVATLPAFLNSLTGKGVHVVTVNDYLAKRDAQWMGPIYHTLGASVACLQHESAFVFDPQVRSEDPRLKFLRPVSRREAYAADITYGTNNEFGFDYLRDNMVVDQAQQVQRGHQYAVVDEVDNILIDEARTPLIISGPAQESTAMYNTFAKLVQRLDAGVDYTVEEKERAVLPTDVGLGKVERLLGVKDLYADPRYYGLTHFLDNALRAKELYLRDRDYVVKDGEVIIVDEFTGRLMVGRRYSEGLHQAIEAKENVKIQRESLTLATITLQNYFRMYGKLAGMTGTAVTEAEELHKIYKLEVVVIPTNRSLIRTELADRIYKDEDAKFKAAAEEIKEWHEKGRPLLVGTVSIEKSEKLAGILQRQGIPHEVLNAKLHEREAVIVAQAGRVGMVTIATNMAGRGTDIILGGNMDAMVEDELRKKGIDPLDETKKEEIAKIRTSLKAAWEEEHKKVVELGGLHIVGTERHEARRIDNQLRGRAGRQGDPGSSRFYVSLEDDILRRFGGDRIRSFMPEDVPLEMGLMSRLIEGVQQKVEAHNFDIRKHLVEYDDVINMHREVIYGERKKVISGADMKDNVQDMVEEEIADLVATTLQGQGAEDWNLEALLGGIKTIFPLPPDLTEETLRAMSRDEVEERLMQLAEDLYEEREQAMGEENMRLLERLVMLRVIDNHWVEHLTLIENLREGIGLEAYAQRDPLVSYKKEAHEAFQTLQEAIRKGIAQMIYHVQLQQKQEPVKTAVTAGAERHDAPKPANKIGRNDPCPCGSGKKYKKCHGAVAQGVK